MKFTECNTNGLGTKNKDGYVRLYLGNRKTGRKLIMRHRLTWQETHGPVPDGQEIDHICKNRACHNIGHLRLIDKSEHRVLTNLFRNKERIDRGKMSLLEGKSPSDVAEQEGVTITTVWFWRRKSRQAISNPLNNPLLPVAHLL